MVNNITYTMYFQMNNKITSKDLLEFERLVNPIDNRCFVENAYDNIFVCHSIIKRESLPQIRDIVESYFKTNIVSYAKTTLLQPSYAEEEEIIL